MTWKKKWGRDKICSISHSRLRPGKNRYGIPYVMTLDCGHSFYTQALSLWVENGGDSCPNCRDPFNVIELTIGKSGEKLYFYTGRRRL